VTVNNDNIADITSFMMQLNDDDVISTLSASDVRALLTNFKQAFSFGKKSAVIPIRLSKWSNLRWKNV